MVCELERLAEPDDGASQRRAVGAVADLLDERLVDLEDVDREALQVAERRIAGAEVVDGEPHAQRLELPQPSSTDSVCCMRTLSVISRITAEGSTPVAARASRSSLHDACALELPAGDVDEHRERHVADTPAASACSWRHASSSTHAPRRHDQPGLLGQRDEVLREQQAVLRVVPPQQRLDAVERARARDRRSAGSAGSARTARWPSGAPPPSPAGPARRRTSATRSLGASLAPALGGVHRHVGVAQQVVGGILAGGRGDADAGAHLDLVAAQRERVGHRRREPLEQRRRAVAARPRARSGWRTRRRRGGPRCRPRGRTSRKPLGRRDQQPVALGVAQAVVHLLEVVEVEEQHGDRPPCALRQGRARGSRGRGTAPGWPGR